MPTQKNREKRNDTFTTLLQQSLSGQFVTSSNLNPPLKLFFYPLVISSNNLSSKICCENVVNLHLRKLHFKAKKNIVIGQSLATKLIVV